VAKSRNRDKNKATQIEQKSEEGERATTAAATTIKTTLQTH